MNLVALRQQLAHWGLINRARGIGYPSMSTTEKARVGRGGLFREPPLPQDLAEIDHAVMLLEPQHKMVIAECYTHFGTHEDHAIRLRMQVRTYFRRRNIAERRVYCLLRRDSDFLQSKAG